MTKGLIARQMGMTQLFNADGTLSAVGGPEPRVRMTGRRRGSIGATDAARVFKGVKMAGQMGNVKTTVGGLKVVRVDLDRTLLLIGGTIPGGKGAVVVVRGSAKAARQAARKR